MRISGMAKYSSKAHQDTVASRRRVVASLRVAHLTEREIHKALIELRNVNPVTGEPWSLGTVHADLVALTGEWREESRKDVREALSERVAEIKQIKRKAWAVNDLKTVLNAIRQECDLLGLNAPKTTFIGGAPGDDPIAVNFRTILDGIDLDTLSDAELAALEIVMTVLAATPATASPHA
jgi:hypothetical protein